MLKAKIRFVIFVLASILSTVSYASNVLILTTAETRDGAVNIINNAVAEFQNAGASVTVNSTELGNGVAMAPSIFTAPGGEPFDIVVVMSTFEPIDLVDWPVIRNAVLTR